MQLNMKKIKLLNRKVKTDYKKIIQALTKAGMRCAVGDYDKAFLDLTNLISAVQLDTPEENLAYRLMRTALVNAAHDLAIEYQADFITEYQEPEKLYDNPDYQKFLDNLTPLLDDTEIELTPSFIQQPRKNPILPPFQAHLHKWFTFFLDPKRWTATDIETITNRLPTYFIFALHHEWQHNHLNYKPLNDFINAPTTPAAQRERQWLTYNAYLQAETERPIFGDSFGLTEIFIQPRAYSTYKQPKTNRRYETETSG